MKLLKKIAAAVLAVAVVATAVKPFDVSASTVGVDSKVGVDWLFVEKDNQVKMILADAGVDLAAVYGVRITFGNVDLTSGAGGAIAYNTPSHNWWDAIEFGNDGAGKPLTLAPVEGSKDLTLTLAEDKPIFTADDIAQRNEEGKALGCCFCLQQYWGDSNLTVTKLEILGKDNAVLKTVPAAAPAPGTGVSPVAIVVSGLAMLVCAAFVVFTSKKRA